MSKAGKLGMGLFAVAALGCSPKVGVKVNVIDRKTQLENQIAGTYTALQNDAWMIASVRSEEGNKALAKVPPEQREVYRAVQNRKFNLDDVREFLGEGCAAEGRDGLLHRRDCDKAKAKAEAERLDRILNQENQDRRTEMKGVLLRDPSLKESDMPDIQQAMGRKNLETAESGWWIEKADGTWIRKP